MEKASRSNLFHYNPQLQKYANELRKNMTKAEACIWKYLLSGRIMKGYQFRRQRPILNYIADFACLDLLLIIEVDGITHDNDEAMAADYQRDQSLEAVGFTVLRFSDWEVLNRMADVALRIGNWIEGNAIVPPPAKRKRGRRKQE